MHNVCKVSLCVSNIVDEHTTPVVQQAADDVDDDEVEWLNSSLAEMSFDDSFFNDDPFQIDIGAITAATHDEIMILNALSYAEVE